MANNNVVIGVARDEKVKDYSSASLFLFQTVCCHPDSIYTVRWSVGLLVESATNSTILRAITKRRFGLLPMLYANMASLMPSTSPAERTTVITAPQMVDCMILVMQTKRARSIRDKEPYLGWYSKKDKHLLPFTHAQVTTTTSLSNLQLRQMVDKYLGMACIPNECSPIAQCNFCSCLAVSCTKEAAPIGF